MKIEKIENLSDNEFDELRIKIDKERVRREEERAAKAIDANQAYLGKFRNLPKEVVDMFEHDRTSCSDTNVSNGWWSNENDQPCCAKCALIETVKGTYPCDKIITFSLVVTVMEP